MNIRYLIIGAGPTGLGAAYKLAENGEHDFLILERNPWVGGLAASFVDSQGFTWDIGGHVQFSHYPYFDRVMREAIPEDRWYSHQRESWVWIHDRFIAYPFQNNIHFLPREALWKCLKGIVEMNLTPPSSRPENFEEWILASFGRGIAEEFMLPYNYKVWAYPPSSMSYQWIGERVATTDIKRILENLVFERLDASWGPNNTFKFPAQGGTGAIWNQVADLVGRHKIRVNTTVAEIDLPRRMLITREGERIGFEYLLSTMPIDALSKISRGLSSKTVRSAQHLKYSSSNIIGVGISGRPRDDLKHKCWMYFPESNCPFYRVTLFSKYSPANVPDSRLHYSLMTETSESPVKAVGSEIVDETIRGLYQTKLIGPDDRIVSVWKYRADYGYPTPSLERDSILNEVVPALERFNVYSRGRFGGWKYEVSNQDHSFMQGVEWASLMSEGKAETTYSVNRSAAEHAQVIPLERRTDRLRRKISPSSTDGLRAEQ